MLKTVRGTYDLYGPEQKKHQYLIDASKSIAANYGFEPIETPIFEFSSVFSALGETSDVVTKETYTFQDRSGHEITLRPEGTAGVMRAIVSNGMLHNIPLKFFYAGPMFRYERPQKGRCRQFHQIGTELVGTESHWADVESIAMAHQVLQSLNLQGSIQLRLNTLGDNISRAAYQEALVNYLSAYKNDLSEDSQMRLEKNPLRILDSKDQNDQNILLNAPLAHKYWSAETDTFFQSVQQGLNDLGISFVVDTKLVRGLDYYCHTVFEFVSDALGAQSTILAGGRYAGLIQRMGGNDLPGVGWAAGIERLALLTKHQHIEPTPIAIVPMGEAAEQHAHMLSYKLRNEGHYVDISYTGNLAKRMKRANKLGSKMAVIFGDDELASNQYTVKYLDEGTQIRIDQENLLEIIPSINNQ